MSLDLGGWFAQVLGQRRRGRGPSPHLVEQCQPARLGEGPHRRRIGEFDVADGVDARGLGHVSWAIRIELPDGSRKPASTPYGCSVGSC